MMANEITRELLFNYFDGKATILQKRMIDEWAREDKNKELFFECLAIWENKNLQYSPDTEGAYHRHLKRSEVALHKESGMKVSTLRTRRSWFQWVAAASFVLGLVGGGYFLEDQLFYQSYATTFGETKSLTLRDGSRVVLNANSSLSVPRFGFGDYTRHVFLKGEANFSVTHLPGNQEFVVQTIEGLDVIVLGTEFTVYARQRGSKVILNKGKIQLSYKENQTTEKQLIMLPGDLVTITKEGKAELTKTSDPDKYSAWKDHHYVFEKISLEDLCILFEENFGIHVEVADPEISSWTVTGAFMAADAEELLEELAESSGLIYKHENDKVIIKSVLASPSGR